MKNVPFHGDATDMFAGPILIVCVYCNSGVSPVACQDALLLFLPAKV